jgi:hypothetical protein
VNKAKEYALSCDNEAGSFLSHQLIAIREKAYNKGSQDRRYELVTALKKQLEEAHEFILKTSGKSNDKRYVKDPDYWHDIGWEKDLGDYIEKYAR